MCAPCCSAATFRGNNLGTQANRRWARTLMRIYLKFEIPFDLFRLGRPREFAAPFPSACALHFDRMRVYPPPLEPSAAHENKRNPFQARPVAVQDLRPCRRPYAGCRHGCAFCYARFMKRFTGHKEPWGEFVDVKVVAPDLQRREITRKRAATMVIWYGVEV